MLYSELLLNRGGGIISDNIKSEMNAGCAVINIGLGGTGIDCLKILKKKVYNSVLPDGFDSETPKYNHIKFIAIDTAEDSIKSNNDDVSNDYASIDKSETATRKRR
nr:hypothetical protein [uncultured Ruminococcus sp.]